MYYQKYPKELVIGFVGEQNARMPGIDISELLSELPGATPTLLFRRPREDAAYPASAALNTDTGILTWTVSSGDVRFPGAGYAQVLLTKSVSGVEKRLMGPVIPVTVMKSVSDDFGEAPDAYDTWLTEAAETLSSVENALEDLQDAVTDAQDAVTDAQDAVTDAQTAVTNANTAITNVNTAIDAANSAAQSLEDMTVSAEAAASAGAVVSNVSGHYHIAFSLPRGEKGDKGDTGSQGPAGTLQNASSTVALEVAGWDSTDKTQSATLQGMTSLSYIIVSPAPESVVEYARCGVYCVEQDTDQLTFTCATIPENAITVNVIRL